MDSGCVKEPLRYCDEPDRLVVDLRPEGVSYIPLASRRVAREWCRPPPVPHVHEGVVEICYCVRGSLSFETPVREYSFLPGTVFVSKEDEPHRMKVNPKGLFVYRVLVALPEDGGCFDGLDAVQSRWLRRKIESLPRRFHASGGALKGAFECLFSAYEDDAADPVRRGIDIRHRSLDILFACVDAAGENALKRRNVRVEHWVKRMEEDPGGDYPLAGMSKDAQLRPAVFAKEFKEIAGLPPQAYLLDCRIRRSMDMLIAGHSVLSVALKLGFCNAQYFSTVFRKHTGLSPREWRKRSS